MPGFSAGIHTATVLVGNTGAQCRMKYSVLGDGVNLASRVGELNSRYGTTIMVSESTATQPAVRQRFLLRLCDCVTVKGKSVGVRVFDVMATHDGALPWMAEVARMHEDAMAAYLGRRFAAAAVQFDAVLRKRPADAAALLLRDRCAALMRAPPPAEWDGAEVLHAKHFGGGPSKKRRSMNRKLSQ